MAIYQANVTIEDDKHQKGKLRFYINYTPIVSENSIDDIIAYIQANIQALDLIIKGRIVNASLSLDIALPGGIKLIADADSDVEEGRRFFYRTFGGFKFDHRVPTFDETLIPDPVQVGFVGLDEDVTAWIILMVDPVTAPEEWIADPCDNRGDSLETYLRSEESFIRSR